MTGGQAIRLSMFSDRVGEEFRISRAADESAITLVLMEAKAKRDGNGEQSGDGEARSFSLVFCDSNATVEAYLPQATYALEHDELGLLDIFIVPIGPDADGKGICYEAVFNLRADAHEHES